VLLLGLGIGANSAVFSFVRGILLRPLPFSGSDRLVILCETHLSIGQHCVVSPPNALDYAARSRALSGIGQTRDWSFQLRVSDNSRVVHAGLATPEVFTVLQTQPAHGRLFLPDEQRPDRNKVVLLSHELFVSFFAADRRVIAARFNSIASLTQWSVMPAGFKMPGFEAELWTPLHFDPRAEDQRSWRGFVTLGRLADGATIEQAQAELAGIAQQLGREHPDSNEGWGLSVFSLSAYLVKSVRPALLLFSAAVALLLLLTCANVAALLLVRATHRHQEFALRLTLGASSSTLLRQVLAEGLLIGGSAGAVACLVTLAVVKTFVLLAPAGVPRIEQITVDPLVIAFAFLLALATALIVMLLPATRLARLEPYRSLRESSSRITARTGLKARRMLVTIEVAVAVTLLVGSSLLMRSLNTMLDWQPGFETSQVLVANSFTPQGKFESADALALLFQRIETQLAGIPGVRSSALVSAGPVFGGIEPLRFNVVGRPPEGPGGNAALRFYDASPSYFRTVGISVLRGRGLLESDRRGSTVVGVINQAAAERYFSGTDPLHQQLSFERDDEPIEIVGVIADIRPFNPDQPAEPEIYWSNRQRPRLGNYLVLRVDGDPARIINAIPAAIRRVDPDIEVGPPRTVEELVARKLVPSRFRAFLMSAFAALALTMAAAGLFGLLAYNVPYARRSSAYAWRCARPRQLLAAVLTEAMWLAERASRSAVSPRLHLPDTSSVC
jgi:predicted permease